VHYRGGGMVGEVKLCIVASAFEKANDPLRQQIIKENRLACISYDKGNIKEVRLCPKWNQKLSEMGAQVVPAIEINF